MMMSATDSSFAGSLTIVTMIASGFCCNVMSV